MKNFFTAIIFFAFGEACAIAQNNHASPVYHLYHYSGDVAAISWGGDDYLKSDFNHFQQCLIRNKKGLFLALNGTGRLYQAMIGDKGIHFERLDSTIYFGDNFESFIFSYRDTTYCLGGYGNWKVKGILRYYVEQKKEWEVARLNKEIPLRIGQPQDLLWYYRENGIIYYSITNEVNSTTTEPIGKWQNTVWKLDLSTKNWKQLGVLSNYLKNNLSAFKNIISSPFGQFAALKNQNVFLDFANNRIYKLSEGKQRGLELLPSNSGDPHVNYFIDSTFYSWLIKKNLFDSLKISKSDLVLLKENIYSESDDLQTESISTSTTPKNLWPPVITAGIIAFLLGFYFKRSTKNRNQKANANEISNGDTIVPFTILEKDVIRCITENSLKGIYTGIGEVNKALGVSKKNPEIQKKQRSDVITAINKKYSYIKRQELELIEKRRTELDKRSFEYFIDNSKLKEATLFIKENNKEP